MKQYFTVIILTTLAIPSVAFAAWWNPLTWFNGWGFSHNTTTQIELTSSPTLPFGLSKNASSTPRFNFDNSISSTTSPLDTSTSQKKVAKEAPTIVEKSNPSNQGQTNTYKKALIENITNMFAAAKTDQEIIDIMLPAVDNRIGVFNDMISKLNTYASNTTDSWIISINNYFINEYTLDKENAESEKNILLTASGVFTSSMNDLTAQASSVSQETEILSLEFGKTSMNLDTILNSNKANSDLLVKAVTDYRNSVTAENQQLDNDYAVLKAKSASLSANPSYNNSQINPNSYIIPSPVTFPIINTARTTYCNFSAQNNGSYGALSGGTITCNSY